MRIRRNIVIFLFSLLFVASMNAVTYACWCRDRGPVLEEFEGAKLVVVARVLSVGELKAVMGVERVFKGKVKEGDQLNFIQGQFSDCVISFQPSEVGQKYLFYLGMPTTRLGKKEPLYEAFVCGRSSKLARAFDDMAYLDRISEVRGKTRISGYFETRLADPPNFEGLIVRIKRKKKSYFVKTDQNGYFEIYDLSPGEYVIEPEIPAGWQVDQKYMFGLNESRPFHGYTVTVKAKHHTSTKIRLIR